MRCYNCKNEKWSAWEGPVKVGGISILGHGSKCSSCGELLFDDAEVERQERAAAATLVERGIRTAAAFRLVRKVAGFKAIEIAELLDVRPETVSRWERGEIDIPRAAAFALGELY